MLGFSGSFSTIVDRLFDCQVLFFQGGLLFRSEGGGGGLRFLLEYYRGHDQQTQFKGDREHYFAFGASADF